ncbi:MAG: hypothetical protein LBV32_01670 [Tannerellaceae bacterium]|jgi:hypothetical protein|nr:hypothetical protein [Tannerellaceae bacterium]
MKEIKITIEEMQAIRIQKSELEKKETILSTPLLTDFTLIDLLYGWFKEGLADGNCPHPSGCVTQRKKFLFLILYFYSPASLAGGKMRNGLRDKLAQVLEMHSRTTISDNCADVVFFYNRYKYFRNEVDDLFYFLTDKLKEERGIFLNPSNC